MQLHALWKISMTPIRNHLYTPLDFTILLYNFDINVLIHSLHKITFCLNNLVLFCWYVSTSRSIWELNSQKSHCLNNCDRQIFDVHIIISLFHFCKLQWNHYYQFNLSALWNKIGKNKSTSIFPIVWNDVNKNMNPKPSRSTFKNFLSILKKFKCSRHYNKFILNASRIQCFISFIIISLWSLNVNRNQNKIQKNLVAQINGIND